MTLAEALDVVCSRTGHERYRWLCSDDNPNPHSRDAYRRLVFDLAGAPPPPEPEPMPEPDPILFTGVPIGRCCG